MSLVITRLMMPWMPTNALRNWTRQMSTSKPGYSCCVTGRPMECPSRQAHLSHKMFIPMPTKRLVRLVHQGLNGIRHHHQDLQDLRDQPRMLGPIDLPRSIPHRNLRTRMTSENPCEARHHPKDNQVLDRSSRCVLIRTLPAMLLLIVAHPHHAITMLLLVLILDKHSLNRHPLLLLNKQVHRPHPSVL
jgi:hypothetical protein